MSTFISSLNTDVPLYSAVCTLQEKGWETFTEEERKMVVALRVEFERDGIHKDSETLEKIRETKAEITELETTFQTNIMYQRKFYGVPKDPEDDGAFGGRFDRMFPEGLLDHVHSAAAAEAAESSAAESSSPVVPPSFSDPSYSSSHHLITTDGVFTSSLLRYASSPSVRAEVHHQSNTLCPSNLPILHSLVKSRDDLARTLGHASYAEKCVQDKMAGTVPAVKNFIAHVRRQNNGKYKAEMELLAEVKKKHTGSISTEPMMPWDTQFYQNLHLQSLPHSHLDSQISSHLSVPSVLSGFQEAVGTLFGMEMREEQFEENEAWTDSAGPGGDVRKYTFYEEGTGSVVGTLYFDLFPREHKYGHAAHFTVRCGCKFYDDENDTVRDQTPIVAVVVNLSQSTGPNTITLGEVETLAHEFGHALHSLLSRTTFQHLSGTRGPADFVEVPSHLFEYLVADPETLGMFAVQGGAGEGVGPELVRRVKRAQSEFVGIETNTQALYADFDQRLFGVQRQGDPVDSTAILRDLHKEYAVPYMEGTHWQSTFGHVNTYGSVYYSYLWAQSIAKDVFSNLSKHRGARPLINREVSGERIFKLLSPGSSREPREVVRDALGGEEWKGYR